MYQLARKQIIMRRRLAMSGGSCRRTSLTASCCFIGSAKLIYPPPNSGPNQL